MKTRILSIVLLAGASLAWAQEDPTLSTDQQAKVKAILSKYDAAALTAKDAHAINEAFREAGLRNGPGLQEAMRQAGFTPQRIGELDPPPGRPSEGGRPDGEADRPPREDAPGGDGGERRAGGDGDGGERPAKDGAGEGGGRPARRGGGGYSIEQAVSDRAQLHTIAFDGLAFLTGEFGGNTFLPPGKVADFCGFQYMRDVDTNQLGHNTSFVPRAANNMLHVLTAAQKAQLVALAREQEPMLTEFARKRFPLVKAFCRELAGQAPAGSDGLNRQAVMRYTAGLFEIDGQLSYRRAQVLGGIVRSLTAEQKAYLKKMVFNNSATWPELKDQMDKRSLSHTAHVAVMTYASEMFSWYAGSVEADVYFCPERHATYFGSFFMKDIPAMGNPNYSISTSLTGDAGEAFLKALTADQRALVTALVDKQRADLKEIVETRRRIAALLRQFMTADTIDKAQVMALSRRYGELDGEISWFYAKAFAQVNRTLSADQRKTLLKLRNLDAKYTPKGAYLYSAPIPMPQAPDTDFLFAAPAGAKASAAPAAAFALTSPAVADGEVLPVEFTGDGAAATLPLAWSGAPAGAKSFALVMHHDAPDRVKWYWLLYDIPASATGLPRNARGVGTAGNNSVNGRAEYAPPHSKGPGEKTYVLTLYALSAPAAPGVPAAQVTRDVLLAAIKDKTLASAQLRVVYSRNIQTSAKP